MIVTDIDIDHDNGNNNNNNNNNKQNDVQFDITKITYNHAKKIAFVEHLICEFDVILTVHRR